MTCKRNHEFRGDENYRARKGWCPHCHREALKRYRVSDKGRARDARYLGSPQTKEKKRLSNARTNPRRIRASRMYLGYVGFTVSETEAMLDGSTE